MEALVKVAEDGRIKPWLAKEWQLLPNSLSLLLEMRPDIHFQDGSPLTAAIVVAILRQSLPRAMGPAMDDVSSIEAIGNDKVEFKLRQPSPFLLEALEGLIQKPDSPGIGTGPFIRTRSTDPVEMRANPAYYLGKPFIDRILVSAYPSVRTAWAELLRNHLDMVYELGGDARDSLQSATAINVYTYVRHYQYLILMNSRMGALHSAAVRRALNLAIDRAAVVQEGLNGHGLASSGPIWPKHWAIQDHLQTFAFDPKVAAQTIAAKGGIKFRCLVAADDERIALVVKRQLQSVGVEMDVEEASIDDILNTRARGDFEAILWAAISGPSILRPYLAWHSHGTFNRGVFVSEPVDNALDTIRHASTDEAYQVGVIKFQQSILDDPPAIFLAWDERARAVSNRFQVPAEPGVDILGTLRMWRPAAGTQPGVN
jgi:peptide/nickel transport system substrate-binding protein